MFSRCWYEAALQAEVFLLLAMHTVCSSYTEGLHGGQVLIIGGCGRVGSAAAIHLLSEAGWCKPMHVTIAGRRDADQMAPVQREILQV